MNEQSMKPNDDTIEFQIAEERPEDVEAIRSLTAAAFAGKPYSDGTEPAIVDALRNSGALTVSLVAIEEDDILGHAAFSPITIDGKSGDWYGLGPLSVHPDHQRKGIGQALVREGLTRLRQFDAGGCVVLGDPGYYRRFGFQVDPTLRYGGAPPEFFQRLLLAGSVPSGEVAFHPGFEVRPEPSVEGD